LDKGKWRRFGPGFVTSGISREVSRRTARKIGKEDFLVELKDWWTMQLELHSGAIDREVELSKAEKRIKKSGQKHVFEEVGVTRVDLERTLDEAIAQMGKSVKVKDLQEKWEKRGSV